LNDPNRPPAPILGEPDWKSPRIGGFRGLGFADFSAIHLELFMSHTTLKAVKTQFDVPKMLEVYSSQQNYEILDLNPEGNCCIIYFSSNGLYYPNTDQVITKEILENNRFEWKKNIYPLARKAILLRDVTKQWYLNGINAQINTIEKLVDFLKQETAGLDTICVGSSAGGYAATLIGCLLSASHVFSFSGQFSLEHLLADEAKRLKNPTLVQYEADCNYRKYYSLLEIVKSSDTPIFYFYPANCDIDVYQNNLVNGLDHIYPFAFNVARHGNTCYPTNFLDLFHRDQDQLLDLYHQYQAKIISPFLFSLKISGFGKTVEYLCLRSPKRLLKSIQKQIRARSV
jgi:hypothetical protein